jgi:enterochelin esterase-like enzyme
MKYFVLLSLFLSSFLVNHTVSAQTNLENQVHQQSAPKVIQTQMHTKALRREMHLTVFLPPDYETATVSYPVLYMNDGQDWERLGLMDTLYRLFNQKAVPHFILIGIHANKNRLQEYGTASQPDYAKRGSKAERYTHFVLKELMPHIEKNYRVKTGASHTFFAGFSLGGLSAIDIVWAHADRFSKVGVFSGSLWWRKKSTEDEYDEEKDRIMHQLIRKGKYQLHLRFWFQAGTEDEISDRNNNGIIDAIDDTLDLMKELEAKGYKRDKDLVYHEVAGGQHNPATWGAVMPVFLKWLFKM